MSLEKIRQDYSYGTETFEVACDSCSNSDEYEVGSWDELLSEMKDDGWKSIRVDGNCWEHKCTDCQ